MYFMPNHFLSQKHSPHKLPQDLKAFVKIGAQNLKKLFPSVKELKK